MKDYPADSRERAVTLRRQGYSYSLIAEKLGVPKSTLSDWLRDIPFEPNQETLARIRRGPLKSGETHRLKRQQQVEQMAVLAREELGNIERRDRLIAGIALYWADGTKSNEDVRFTNSDPQQVRFMMNWFRECCGVPDECFRIGLHLYPDIDPDEAIQYWAEITGLPPKQFYRPQVDRRLNKRQKKHGQLPFGTVQIRVVGGRKYGKAFHRKIMGWIAALQN